MVVGHVGGAGEPVKRTGRKLTYSVIFHWLDELREYARGARRRGRRGGREGEEAKKGEEDEEGEK